MCASVALYRSGQYKGVQIQQLCNSFTHRKEKAGQVVKNFWLLLVWYNTHTQPVTASLLCSVKELGLVKSHLRMGI